MTESNQSHTRPDLLITQAATSEHSDRAAKERQYLDEIRLRIGIELPRLHNVELVQESKRADILEIVASWIDGEADRDFRLWMYRQFTPPSGAKFLEQLLGWFRRESYQDAISVLGRCALFYATRKNKEMIYGGLLSRPLMLDPLLLGQLIGRSKMDRNLHTMLSMAYKQQAFDLESLAAIADRKPSLYDFLISSEASGTRLSAAQCTSLVTFQIPRSQYGFRRPDFVPFFGVIKHSEVLSEAELISEVATLCRRSELGSPPRGHTESRLRKLLPNDSALLNSAVPEDNRVIRGIVCTRLGDRNPPARQSPQAMLGTRHSHRTEGSALYWLAVVDTPVPQPDNLFPKVILAADDPFRRIRSLNRP